MKQRYHADVITVEGHCKCVEDNEFVFVCKRGQGRSTGELSRNAFPLARKDSAKELSRAEYIMRMESAYPAVPSTEHLIIQMPNL